MNTQKYRWILYAITFTIVATIVVQVFWNYKNYQLNKQRVVNEIQLSLDNALEEYFAIKIKSDFPKINGRILTLNDSTFLNSNGTLKRKVVSISGTQKLDTVITHGDGVSKKGKIINIPSRLKDVQIIESIVPNDSSLLVKNLKSIFISVSNTPIQYEQLDSLLHNQLKNKNIEIEYHLTHSKGDSLFFNSNHNKVLFNWSNHNKDSILINSKNKFAIKWNNVNSKSTFLKNNEQFNLLFKDSSYEALKRSSTGILLSFLLSIAIISCLFYLLKIINKQKQLAEMKNDLISNITHEFKTPIATVSTAIEALNSFNAMDDIEKRKNYLSISSVQLKKLHQMVEKLLETATLDSDSLLLQKESTDLIQLIKNCSQKNELLTTDKTIQFNSSMEELYINIDPFHFENAISNLLDNAIKYGGDLIEIHINSILNNVEISVADNGNQIEKQQRDKIFEKFYRIPKGNTHDVKGFGIGLYYTKKIIEKHNGKIHLEPNSSNTVFKIVLPK